MSRSSRPRAPLYSMLLKSEKKTEWTGGREVKLQKW